MPFRVVENIHHGDLRSERSAPIRGEIDFREFLKDSPYAPNDERVDALGLPVSESRLDQVAREGYRVISIGRTFQHGWAEYRIERTSE